MKINFLKQHQNIRDILLLKIEAVFECLLADKLINLKRNLKN